MLFSSLTFVFGFLFLVLIIYFCLLKTTKIKNLFLFFVSILFYAWGEPKFVLVMLLSIFMNYIFGLLVDKYREHKTKSKLIIVLTLIFNLSLIFVYKYLMFFMTTINSLTGLNFTVPIINLPIGISFFTFQSISYVIDIYRNNGKVQKNIFNVGLYIAFFPQLIAGPIVRYETIAEQINNRKENIEDFSKGCSRFIVGFAKKILISNQMAIIADAAFDSVSQISIGFAWLGALAYTLQIYYDFSGYSDMAIGLGKMFGFHFNENFNYPYISKNITEFWRRWHISLSTWFRDYVYIPLGGSRVNKFRLVINLLIVWLLTGIWHGASWNFIIWGLYYFVFLVIEKLLFIKKFNDSTLKTILTNTLGRIYTLLVVIFGWVLFRAENLTKAVSYIKTMLGITTEKLTDLNFLKFIQQKSFFIIIAIIFSIPLAKIANKIIENTSSKVLKIMANTLYPVVLTSLFIISIAYLIKCNYNPFIYFNF